MKKYDLTLLVEAGASSEVVDGVVAKLEKMVKALNGSTGRVHELGSKQLAYRMGNTREATFLSWVVELPANAVVELQKKLTVDKAIIRQLLVINDK